MQLTIDLPESAFERLSRLAELTNQPLSNLVIQSITGNLPPEIEMAPAEIRSELLALQSLSVEALRQIAQSQIPTAQQQRHIALLEGDRETSFSEAEQQELQQLSQAADRLMLKKAHACAILRWRGEPISLTGRWGDGETGRRGDPPLARPTPNPSKEGNQEGNWGDSS